MRSYGNGLRGALGRRAHPRRLRVAWMRFGDIDIDIDEGVELILMPMSYVESFKGTGTGTGMWAVG